MTDFGIAAAHLSARSGPLNRTIGRKIAQAFIQPALTTTRPQALKSHKNSLLSANTWLKRSFEFLSMV
jgi:hypothetical protein